MSVSSCCGAAPRVSRNGDCDTSDFGICPDCGEHCEYYEEDDFDEDGNLIEDKNDNGRGDIPAKK